MRRIAGIAALIVVSAALGWLTLSALSGRWDVDSATGKVVSITTVSTGKVVCVVDNQNRRRECGEVSLPDRPSVTLDECAHIRVARGAAITLERRPCSN